MSGLENIGEIASLLKGHVTPEKLADWMEQNNWEEKKKKVGEIKTALFKDARGLVNTTLAIARVVPSVNTISSYKRALESLVLLKKIIPPKKNKNKEGALITPERVKEFADAAGLSYSDILPGNNEPENNDTDVLCEEIPTAPVNDTGIELSGENKSATDKSSGNENNCE
jgi:hypothetical protein